jgi:hypothetical protein
VHHTSGLLKPDVAIAAARDRSAKFAPVRLDAPIQRILLAAALVECQRQCWRLHGLATDPSHLHAVMHWIGFDRWAAMVKRWKKVVSFVLGRDVGPRGRRWFVRGASRKRALDRSHLDYLLDKFLPAHRGVFWREGKTLG